VNVDEGVKYVAMAEEESTKARKGEGTKGEREEGEKEKGERELGVVPEKQKVRTDVYVDFEVIEAEETDI
jgi:hypothetical protein